MNINFDIVKLPSGSLCALCEEGIDYSFYFSTVCPFRETCLEAYIFYDFKTSLTISYHECLVVLSLDYLKYC